MKLAQYLADRGISYTEFAPKIGTRHPRTVERYAKGHRTPTPKMMGAIRRATDGLVTPNDFIDDCGN